MARGGDLGSGFDAETEATPRHEVARLADEFRGTFGEETIARLEGARVQRYVPTFASRFTHDRLRALAAVEGRLEVDRPRVLFVCVRDAARSQIVGLVGATTAASSPPPQARSPTRPPRPPTADCAIVWAARARTDVAGKPLVYMLLDADAGARSAAAAPGTTAAVRRVGAQGDPDRLVDQGSAGRAQPVQDDGDEPLHRRLGLQDTGSGEGLQAVGG